MGANLITWSGQTVTPQYDALVFGLFAPDGIIYGVDITQSASDPNIINISNGYGIIQGRFFTIEEFSVNVELTTGATYQGQLILHMDLSNADEPISVVVDTGATIRSLIKDADVNIVNGIYEIQLCTFTVDAAAVTDIAITYPEAIKYSFDSIAESEMSPALKNHSVGDYIAYNGKLYRVTTAITAGSTLDGKISETSIGVQMQPYPDYRNRTVLHTGNNKTTNATVNGTMTQTGFLLVQVTTSTTNGSPFIRVTINGFSVYEYFTKYANTYIYATSPLIPVRNGDTYQIIMGTNGVATGSYTVTFIQAR